MRLTSRLLTFSATPKTPTTTKTATSFCCCLRHLNKKFFIAFVILILTLTGCCIWLQNDAEATLQQPQHHQKQQQQHQQQHQSAQQLQLPTQKLGQTNLLPKLVGQQQHEKLNATLVSQTATPKTTTTLTITTRAENLLPPADDDSRRQQQEQAARLERLRYEPRRDWHDYVAIGKDAERSPNDLGEFGKPAYLTTDSGADIESEVAKSLQKFGFNLPLSDAISVQRALPDFRHERCQDRSYHAYLPTASIIIVYHNEQRSVLLRTLHSLINRTPARLIKEILLIDDLSDAEILGEDFEDFLEQNFENKTRIVHAKVRLGLVKARLLGAREAIGEVLVFLDAHVEATHNWLPPLLEPIYQYPKTCTTPTIDTIHYETFAYVPAKPARGGFNWQFNYVQLPLRLEERLKLPEPYANPVMNGGLFAIQKQYFWELGGYDEGLEIWGAEEFELSFKLWLCGGRLLEVPCARLGHLFRSPLYQVKYTNRTDDFIARNYKRIAEVWLDNYKDVLYEHVPKLNSIDAGDLSVNKALRKRLKCRNFAWFLKTIAPDLLQIYPPLEPADFASGAIQSLAEPTLCLDYLDKKPHEIAGFLRGCSPDLRHPYATQSWSLSFRRDLRNANGDCLEPQTWASNAPLWLWQCHHQGGNQYWYYDRLSHMLVQGNGANETERRCLEADLKEKRVFLNYCDFAKLNMKWHFGFVNQTAMDSFFKDINLN